MSSAGEIPWKELSFLFTWREGKLWQRGQRRLTEKMKGMACARMCRRVCARVHVCVLQNEGEIKITESFALWKTLLDAHLPAACLIKRMYNKWRMSKCKILHAAMITFVENADSLMRNWLLLRVRENQNDLQPPTYTNTIIIIKKINNTHLSYLSAVSRSKVISTIVFKRRVSE